MPSVHFATAVAAAHALDEIGPAPGALAWTHRAILGFALVYTGEHYVVDLLAALAVAEAIRLLGPRLHPVLDRVAEVMTQLEHRAHDRVVKPRAPSALVA